VQSFTKNHPIPASMSVEARNAEIVKRREEHEAGVDLYAQKHFAEIKERLDRTRDAARLMDNSKCKV
jgi:hypothetical protein